MKLSLKSILSMFIAIMLAAPAIARADDITLKVGATPVPHAEILEIVRSELVKEGINLEIIEYTDYVQPNLALDMGDLDANFFQHTPYLGDFNAENGTRLISAVAVHFEPLGLYAGKTKSLDELHDGASIAVPNDTTNEARALLLLESLGFIELPSDSGLTVTPRDIVSNPRNLEFKEIEAAQITNFLQDVDLGVINGNYALSAGLGALDTLASEDSTSMAALTYANILAVRDGDKSRPEIQALIKAITSQSVADFINEKYEGSVITVFEGETPKLNEIASRGKIIIGVYEDKIPFSYIDENGSGAGLDVSFGNRIAFDLLGDKNAVEFVALQDGYAIELESGNVDIALGVDIINEDFGLSLPYLQAALNLDDSVEVDDEAYAFAAVKKGDTDLLQWINKLIIAVEAENFR